MRQTVDNYVLLIWVRYSVQALLYRGEAPCTATLYSHGYFAFSSTEGEIQMVAYKLCSTLGTLKSKSVITHNVAHIIKTTKRVICSFKTPSIDLCHVVKTAKRVICSFTTPSIDLRVFVDLPRSDDLHGNFEHAISKCQTVQWKVN